MAKQLIIAAIEEVCGEYILNMSSENIRIAALKGEIKLEDVQLDGDLVGSHFLGIVGLSNFGVLSCSAKSIRISVPWKQLEKEPTRVEVSGIHLVAVPLTPTTANQIYGSGTAADPRCSLRTRAKRLTLARFERNFWNGQIPGEGPPLKRVTRAVKDVEREMKQNKRNSKQKKGRHQRGTSVSSSSLSGSQHSTKSTISDAAEYAEMEEALDELVQSISTDKQRIKRSNGDDKNSIYNATNENDDLPNLPRDWKVKLREKVMRNLEAKLTNVHIRCEVPQPSFRESDGHEKVSNENYDYKDDRAFALGFTLDSLVVRTANENWEVGSHDTRNPVDGSAMSSVKDHLGPNEYVVVNNKIGYFNNVSVYWDDDPPVLLAETDALQGNHMKLSSEKINSSITAAMDALFHSQDPGPSIRSSLSLPSSADVNSDVQHRFVCESLNAEVRVRTSDRTIPGPISCSADVLPFDFTFNLRAQQIFQYYRLKSSILSQQRFDTMLRRRPCERPVDNPRSWWVYAISCVMSRPNSRPWEDVLPIVQSRERYIELVKKKNSKSSGSNGYHSGLSSKESDELLMLEDLLPIEALMAFHKIALRKVYAAKQRKDSSHDSKPVTPKKESHEKSKSILAGRFRLPRLSTVSNRRKIQLDADVGEVLPSSLDDLAEEDEQLPTSLTTSAPSLLESMNLRLGRKVWFVDWKLHDAVVYLHLHHESDSASAVQIVLRADGNARSFGIGKRDFLFDVTQFDVLHRDDKVLFVSPFDDDSLAEEDPALMCSVVRSREGSKCQGPDMNMPSTFLELPPPGSVCRIVAGKNVDSFKLSMSAHPATLVWTTSLLKGLSDFIAVHCADPDYDLTAHIRNAATPLARKAQLTLLSPASMSLHLNIAAPKVWIPLVSSDKEGTLFIDAGTIKFASIKKEGETDADWELHARDIGVTFVRGINPTKMGREGHSHFRTYGVPYAPTGKIETSVIKPLSIDAKSRRSNVVTGEKRHTLPRARNSSFVESVRHNDISISPICLNLVDAEMLARSFGKWYALCLGRVKRRVLSGNASADVTGQKDERQNDSREAESIPQVDIPRVLSINIEKVEMALEGHSKKLSASNDDRSITSLDTLLESATTTRAYLVEVFRIALKRSYMHDAASTSLSVMDASIIRLKDVSTVPPLKSRREAIESEYCVLSRATKLQELNGSPSIGTARSKSSIPSPGIFRASLFHNRATHLDEVELDIDSVVLRVTPMTLKDCAKAFRRIAELAQLVTKEMERKVHEEGRKARRRDRLARECDGSRIGSVAPSIDRPVSPSMSDVLTDVSAIDNSSSELASLDSSILFRVTVNECTLLAGRPTSTLSNISQSQGKNPSFVVFQVVSNALIMFQSIENPDASGSKTLHVSVDNVSALVNTEFRRVTVSESSPMIEPTGAEFRVVYSTENFGCVVSQDVSFDCEAIRSCLTPNDLSIMINISRTMYDRLRAFGVQDIPQRSDDEKTGNDKLWKMSSLIRYKKKGTGIATRVRAEIQTFSFVLLKTYKSHSGAPEFLDFNVKEVKASFEGCMSALSGDFTGLISVNFFNSDSRDWEYAVEPFSLTVGVEQMPNEVLISVAPSCAIQLNVTGILLRDFAEVQFDILRDGSGDSLKTNGIIPPSALSTVGLRRASESRSVTIQNSTGLDIEFIPESFLSKDDPVFVKNGTRYTLKYTIEGKEDDELTLALRIASSAVDLIGDREPVRGLPVGSRSKHVQLYLLKSSSPLPAYAGLFGFIEGRTSPETILSETTDTFGWGYYNAEPVVEWCMQNQRLKPTVADLYSLPKGRDLLSNSVWSPEDEVHEGDFHYKEVGPHIHVYSSENADASKVLRVACSPEQASNKLQNNSNWLPPYLTEDSPEWTDMTCMLRMARERFMLPDNRWMWVNEWSVEINGKLGKDTDADGWSYANDFGAFSNTKYFYGRGATCRRRRWTRTRIPRPPRLDDPHRQIKFVWENLKKENGTMAVRVRSHVRVFNNTPYALAIFAFSLSWETDFHVGIAQDFGEVSLPVLYASSTHLRIARKTCAQENLCLADCLYSDRFMIIPASHTSSRFERTYIDLNDVSRTTLHFLVEVRCVAGIVDVVIEPVFRIINLLPCQLECKVGEVATSRDIRSRDRQKSSWKVEKGILKTESLKIQSGKVGACTAVDPSLKPHISFRVPGYKWSNWHRIVNSSTDTWRPSVMEEDLFFASKGDNDYADEMQSLVRFESFGKRGDPLILIVSFESGHSPVIRIFAQYWILDKTGFGCHFTEGFADLMGSVPDADTSRRSYLLNEETVGPDMKADLASPGHQWSMGQSGMTMYFSKRAKLSLAIETGILKSKRSAKSKSKWISPLDVSNVIPKTVFSVDELNGHRRFELAIHVAMCQGVFGRTKMITLLPRYQIVNLLHRELLVCQDGCPDARTLIPSQSAMPLHWENGSLDPKIRLGTPSVEERVVGRYDKCWTNGRVQVDRVGITSMRLPTSMILFAKVPMVIQAEVRLATQEQSSAVVIVIWSGDEKSNPLYMLRNRTRHTILCRQIGDDEFKATPSIETDDAASFQSGNTSCGIEIGPSWRSYLGLKRVEEFVWTIRSQESTCFGLENPEKPHVVQWGCADNDVESLNLCTQKAYQDVDAMGTSSIVTLSSGLQVRCLIRAEHSTKVIEFVEYAPRKHLSSESGGDIALQPAHLRQFHEQILEFDGIRDIDTVDLLEDDESISLSLRIDIPSLSISVIDNANPEIHGREILLCHFEKALVAVSQGREGYHEFEVRLAAFQVDNHVPKSVHPILIFCPRVDDHEPLLHMSAVRRLQLHSNTRVFRYAAIRILEVEIFLDRRTAETIASFIQPLMIFREMEKEKPPDWVAKLTSNMQNSFGGPDQHAHRTIEKMVLTANSGRIYFEQLYLHPVRLSLTFTQEWMDWNQSADTVMIFQFIRGMASIANAPLVFTSFFVGHVFEAPQALLRIIATHYSSQLTKQIFGILGSLAILGAPADFISNVGTGVRDFFYEPIQGAVHGPRQFIEGLEAGTQSLARGVFVGVVRGAANVTDVVNSNLAGLTADDDFIGERKAYRRLLTDAMSRGASRRTFSESLSLACASVARGVKSGALGIVEQPARFASKHGPVGLLKGVGMAMIGAVVKPVVGLGDGVVLVMNHMSDATSKEIVFPKIPKRLRRALPSRAAEKPNCVSLEPYDERAAKAQTIVTGGDSVDDVYLGHVNIQSHLIIASEQCLWAIDKVSCNPWCVSWREISHFRAVDGSVRIVIFSQTGLKTYVFQVENQKQSCDLQKLLCLQLQKMANQPDVNCSVLNTAPERLPGQQIPGIKVRQLHHIFGSSNNTHKRGSILVKDEVDLVEQTIDRVRKLSGDQPSFLKCLDEEAWQLISSWGQIFSGLSSRRCVIASIINGSGHPIQIKSAKLLEGGSPCYSIPTKEFDTEQGILNAGGVIMFFGSGIVPNLTQAGNVFMCIETNAFICELVDQKSRDTDTKAMPGYQVGFLEKSYDDSGWWAKYWLLVRGD